MPPLIILVAKSGYKVAIKLPQRQHRLNNPSGYKDQIIAEAGVSRGYQQVQITGAYNDNR